MTKEEPFEQADNLKGGASTLLKEIIADRIKLVPLSLDHAKMIYDNREFAVSYNSNGITKEKFDALTFNDSVESTKESVEEMEKGDRFTFIVLDKGNNEYIGRCGLHTLNKGNESGRVSISIKERFWGKGYGTEILSQLINFAFEEAQLHRLEYGCFSFNEGSKRLAEKCGFKLDGVMREAKKIGDEYFDRFEYGMLIHEYKMFSLDSESSSE